MFFGIHLPWPDATGCKSHRRVMAAANDSHVPLFAPFAAVQARVRDLGQWRQARSERK